MYKKTLTYTNLNGEQATESLYFNLSKRDALKIFGKYSNGTLDEKTLQLYLDKLKDSKDVVKMVSFIEDVILSAYGEKSEDGKYFMKDNVIRTRFENSVAYAEVFEELFTNPKELNEFIKGIFPNFSNKASESTTASIVA